jgi:hypothetical protein
MTIKDINVELSRILLGKVAPYVRKSGHLAYKDGSTYHYAGSSSWEFHGPDKFYWHGDADNVYDARYKGWSAYLEKQQPEIFDAMEKDTRDNHD